jgi:rSAM/selenodomain-associated transferase 1
MSGNAMVLLFIKAPVRGRVKSRLAAAIGDDAALQLYRHFILDVIGMLTRTAAPFRICCYPPEAMESVAHWLGPRYRYLPQEGNDLGDRMNRAFERIFSEGFDRAVLIGSDIPDLKESVIAEAFDALDRCDAVLGPASDGGYYLVGFNRNAFLPDLFRGFAWSTPEVFQNSMTILRKALLRVHLLPVWSDVDTVEDLNKLIARNEHSGFKKSGTMTYLDQQNRKGTVPAACPGSPERRRKLEEKNSEEE